MADDHWPDPRVRVPTDGDNDDEAPVTAPPCVGPMAGGGDAQDGMAPAAAVGGASMATMMALLGTVSASMADFLGLLVRVVCVAAEQQHQAASARTPGAPMAPAAAGVATVIPPELPLVRLAGERDQLQNRWPGEVQETRSRLGVACHSELAGRQGGVAADETAVTVYDDGAGDDDDNASFCVAQMLPAPRAAPSSRGGEGAQVAEKGYLFIICSLM